jgi:hypothetical protein
MSVCVDRGKECLAKAENLHDERVGFLYDSCVLPPVQVNNAYYVIDKYANF